MKYADKLKDPRWQKKRLEVFQRDGFSCVCCCDDSSTLHVHHKVYLHGKEPWEYPIHFLVTLCEQCHEHETLYMRDACDALVESMKRNFFAKDIADMAEQIKDMKLHHASEVVSSVYGWAFSNPDIQKELISRYFDHISEKK